jgi:transposase
VPGIPTVDVNGASHHKKPKKPRENGGRFGFEDYPHAPTVTHEVEGCQPGDSCNHCGLGKYYEGQDRKQLEFSGGSIVTVKRHIKKTLRCNRCGHEKLNHQKIVKWKPEARSALVIHKIYGIPWYRISRLQKLSGIPIAMSTQWTQCKGVWEDAAKYVVSELYRLGIEHPLWCTDDTGMKILSVLKANALLPESEQRACHTTAIHTGHGEFKIILYMTANQYCRENWVPLLEQRKTTDKVVIMTDASNQSLPKAAEQDRAESAVCLGGHARKKFKEVEANYPIECGYFLNLVANLYKNEADCKGMAPQKRLEYHQEHSAPIIDAIYTKIAELYNNRIIEPNSDLGKAMNYWLNHRKGLTAFLRIKGIPLDNNWAENALRIMAIYRNASLFFKTLSSAMVMSDLFSLVATCEANGINAFAYLNWIQVHWKAVQATPQAYLPWCFEQETEKIAC